MKAAKTSTRTSRRVRETPPALPRPVLRYLESSALVGALLERRANAMRALEEPAGLIASALTFAEARRAIVRARVAGRIPDVHAAYLASKLETIAARCEIVAITGEILARTGRAFPVEPVRTLDAIHLATLESIGAPQAIELISRDERIVANARALGYTVIGAG